jgi:hypothetical protein
MGCEWMVTVQAEVGDFQAIYQAANELSKSYVEVQIWKDEQEHE